MINVGEFIVNRGVEKAAVSMYIRRHPDIFNGHTSLKNNQLYLDDVAFQILDKQYPMPIQIVEDHHTQERIAELEASIREKDKIIAALTSANTSLIEKNEILISDRDQYYLLENKKNMEIAEINRKYEEQLKNKDEENYKKREELIKEYEQGIAGWKAAAESWEKTADHANERADNVNQKYLELKEELETEKKKSWWDKLWHK